MVVVFVQEVSTYTQGGTVGDIESMPFVEALRQFQFRVGLENMCFLHVSLVPLMGDELKTKPTQHSVRELRSLGLQPDFIMCRSTIELDQNTKKKVGGKNWLSRFLLFFLFFQGFVILPCSRVARHWSSQCSQHLLCTRIASKPECRSFDSRASQAKV